MKAVFRFQDYRKAIRFLMESTQKLDPALTYQRLAEAITVQKSYLSQVLGGRAELSTDQSFLLCQFFGSNEEEEQYFLMLVEFSRTGVAIRRKKLQAEIAAVQQKKLASEKHIKVNTLTEDLRTVDYYVDAYNQLVHVCLSIDKYRKNPNQLAEALRIHPERLQEIIAELVRLEIVELEKSGLKVIKKNLHLPKDSKVFKAWRSQVRAMALQQSLHSPSNESYNFSVFFSCSLETKAKIHQKFLDFLTGTQELVSASNEEHVFQMNFDLLKWL